METTETIQLTVPQARNYAADMLFSQGKNSYEVVQALVSFGIAEEDANGIVEDLEAEVVSARRSKAQKDMLYGALWCIGGIVLTMANVGFIFWGAIVFGAIQFFRGATNL
jgi:hypothetical protein